MTVINDELLRAIRNDLPMRVALGNEGLTDGSAAPILIRFLPTDRPTHGAVGLPCCADRARRQLGLVVPSFSRIPDNSAKPPNHPANPYRQFGQKCDHNSARQLKTARKDNGTGFVSACNNSARNK